MIQSGQNFFKPCLQSMWKLCFPDDSERFIDFYFNEVYKNEETLAYLVDDKPVSSLQVIPYSLKIGAEIRKAGYISGSMTHPQHRNRGYMAHLLNAAAKAMTARNYDYLFLIPQNENLVDFYKKFGYKTVMPIEKQILPETWKPEPSNIQSSKKQLVEAISHLYISFLQQISNTVLKSVEQTRLILKDLSLAQGMLFVEEQGLAFATPNGEGVLIKELLCANSATKNSLFQAISKHFKTDNMSVLHAPFESSAGWRGMIKRLNDNCPEINNLYINMMLE